MTDELPKRRYVFLKPPKSFEMSLHDCGDENPMWSEFEKHLWCPKCCVDFIPKHAGVFGGPILANVLYMLGGSLDRYDLESKRIERFDLKTGEYVVEEPEEKEQDGNG